MTTVSSWAVKYRPKSFEEVVGQSSAVAKLQGSIARKALPNALMISGPTGTGKTTLARLYARYINCKTYSACGKCASCLSVKHPDIEESNAAEARGIDDMRSLIARSNYRPVHRVRVFIQDEAQQLTSQSLQAFLKPLEEPAPNTMYILCTTDPQKFPKTVINRCLQINLNLPDADSIASRLSEIAKAEQQRFPKELYLAIAQASGGHIREAVGVLENCANMIAADSKITREQLLATVSATGGTAVANVAQRILLGLYTGRPAMVMKAVFDVEDATQTINQCIWFNEYALAQILEKETRVVWHSPINKEFAAMVRAKAPDTKLADILVTQRKLVALRNQLHSTSVKETSLLLAYL
jgi:DNA polymerase III subunit gamma/tau